MFYLMKFFFAVICISHFVFANNFYQKGFIPKKNGLVIAYEKSIPNPQNPVLVLLPGIFRGLTIENSFLKKLTENKINWVSFHFSLQPESHLLIKNTSVFQLFSQVNLDELRNEPFLLTSALKINKPIFVSLSYSSLISSGWSLNKVPWMIEVSPMGRYDEQNPGFSAYGNAWESWMKLIPFWGPVITSSTKELAYFNYWTMMVQGLRVNHPELNQVVAFNQAVKGYMQMSKLAEGFDLRQQDFSQSPKKIYVIGEKEDSYRLQLQKESIILDQKTKGITYIFLMKDAGHIIPMDSPEGYLQVIKTVYNGQLQNGKSQALVTKEGKINWLR
ncbi:MAG: hypothetical protein L6Q37_02870 [Bdellovibrionaceae bacterium]|nr:hypothetical protein [Pseudobdellovibrionaceae bacterium]